jgi:hypothetical protein
VSKRLGSPYRSGRSKHWVKVKNSAAAARREEVSAAFMTSAARAERAHRYLTPSATRSRIADWSNLLSSRDEKKA